MMESLLELVAASFVRHGIECPAHDSVTHDSLTHASPTDAVDRTIDLMPHIVPAALLKPGYRKKPEAGLAT